MGLNGTIRAYGAALADEGFVVGLPDLFNGAVAVTVAEAETLIRTHWETTAGRLSAAFTELNAHLSVRGTRLGGIGFSFGGYHLLAQLGVESRLGALVTYYATYAAQLAAAPVLAHFAEQDEFESDADRDAMIAAMAPSVAHIYPGTKHWFAEADRPEYDVAAATLAFERTVAFLSGTIG